MKKRKSAQDFEFSVATPRASVFPLDKPEQWGDFYAFDSLLRERKMDSIFFSADYGKHWVSVRGFVNMYTAERDEIKFNPIQAFEMELKRLWPRLRSWYIRRTVFRDPWF